jgi:hypothetical protein
MSSGIRRGDRHPVLVHADDLQDLDVLRGFLIDGKPRARLVVDHAVHLKLRRS